MYVLLHQGSLRVLFSLLLVLSVLKTLLWNEIWWSKLGFRILKLGVKRKLIFKNIISIFPFHSKHSSQTQFLLSCPNSPSRASSPNHLNLFTVQHVSQKILDETTNYNLLSSPPVIFIYQLHRHQWKELHRHLWHRFTHHRLHHYKAAHRLLQCLGT